MPKLPVAATLTEGRTFGTDWTIAHVAKLLRANAGMGTWDSSASGGSAEAVNQFYLRKVSARHMRTRASLIFMRLAKEDCWYLSLCFADASGYLPWNPIAAEQWLCALFGEDRPRIREENPDNPTVRQFTL